MAKRSVLLFDDHAEIMRLATEIGKLQFQRGVIAAGGPTESMPVYDRRLREARAKLHTFTLRMTGAIPREEGKDTCKP